MKTVTVKTRMSGGTWLARAGHGRRACTASCTMGAEQAARSAAAKFFRIDACNVLTADDLIVRRLPDAVLNLNYSEDLWSIAMPEGEAS